MKKECSVKLSRSFRSSSLQYLGFFVIYLGFYMLVFLTVAFWSLFANVFAILEFLIPIGSAFFWCYFVNRHNIAFSLRKGASRTRLFKLGIRLLAVFCCILVGFFVSLVAWKARIFNFLYEFGDLGDFINSLVCNFMFYLMVAEFPATFAFVECLFVNPEVQNRSRLER